MKAVGWVIEEYARAQVSVNVTNYEVAGLEAVLDACEEEARLLGVRVTGSELVGLVPLAAMRQAGRHYLAKQGQCTGQSDARLVEVAVQSLGLAELKPFKPHEAIIEWRLAAGRKSLAGLTLDAFADELASDSPAPGGGSVAALVGGLGAALCSMVANLSVGRKGLEASADVNNRVAEEAQALKSELLRAIDDDTRAFEEFMAASRLPKAHAAEAALRATALDAATQRAVEVPLHVLGRMLDVARLAAEALRHGNPNAASDAASAAACALAAAEAAHYNVLTNIRPLDPVPDWAAKARRRATTLMECVSSAAANVQREFLLRMEPGKN